MAIVTLIVLVVLVIGFSLPYAHKQGSHIGVEILVRRFSRRARKVIRAVTDLAAAVLFGLVTWRLVLYGQTLRRSGEVSIARRIERGEAMVLNALARLQPRPAVALVALAAQHAGEHRYARFGKGVGRVTTAAPT